MLLVAMIGLRASRKLFSEMLACVLHAPMSFFDTTPVGRIVNRFSKDMYTADEKLMPDLSTYLATLFSVFSTIAVIAGVTPVFLIFLAPMIMFYVSEQKFFTITYRELKRLDSVNRSPIYALLGESVDGVSVIRSFSAQDSLFHRLVRMLNTQQHAYFLTCSAQSWLAVRLELIGTLIITFTCLSAVVEHWLTGADETFAGMYSCSSQPAKTTYNLTLTLTILLCLGYRSCWPCNQLQSSSNPVSELVRQNGFGP